MSDRDKNWLIWIGGIVGGWMLGGREGAEIAMGAGWCLIALAVFLGPPPNRD